MPMKKFGLVREAGGTAGDEGGPWEMERDSIEETVSGRDGGDGEGAAEDSDGREVGEDPEGRLNSENFRVTPDRFGVC
jgi:hypothetical protein